MTIRRRQERNVPALNTTSTADISFMLLIFFLVVSSLDTDKGLARQLPPTDKQEQVPPTEVNRDRVMELRIDANNQLSVDGKPTQLTTLQSKVEEFVIRVGKDHLLTVETDPNATYESYFNMQNTIVAAYKSARNKWALKQYKRPFGQLSYEQQMSIREALPQRIAERYNTSVQAPHSTEEQLDNDMEALHKGGLQ